MSDRRWGGHESARAETGRGANDMATYPTGNAERDDVMNNAVARRGRDVARGVRAEVADHGADVGGARILRRGQHFGG